MPAIVIDGSSIARNIRNRIKDEVATFTHNTGIIPCIVGVLVGNREDSEMYIRMKKKRASEVGIKFSVERLPEDITQDSLVDKIWELNENPDVHAILVQVPLPKHVNQYEIFDAVSPKKDVDGFHSSNIGKLATINRRTQDITRNVTRTQDITRNVTPSFVSCTARGCMELLKVHNVKIKGANAVVVGYSHTVGMPMALMLLQEKATVTICHIFTKNIQDKIARADIIVIAIGCAEYIKGSWLKPGCVVIDVGINFIDDLTKVSGRRVVGDVDFKSASEVASLITPVPGGVGPMTVAMLLQGTLEAAKHSI